MKTPYQANLEAAHPKERNYASENPEIVKKQTDLLDIWAEDVFIHSSIKD